jgi:hypothetical protein
VARFPGLQENPGRVVGKLLPFDGLPSCTARRSPRGKLEALNFKAGHISNRLTSVAFAAVTCLSATIVANCSELAVYFAP